MDALMRLLQAVPRWATCIQVGRSTVAIDAAVPRAGGVLSRKYGLLLKEQDSHISIKEAPYLRILPVFCPDRHINPDGTFCLGLNAGYIINEMKAASQWWNKLLVFLTCQETAHETRTWPGYARLSHGQKAAEIQLKAEDLARKLGLQNEYEAAVQEGNDSMLYASRYSNSLLGVKCWDAGKEHLLILERQRQSAVEEFWALFDCAPCCGTMDGCPFRRVDFSVNHSPSAFRMK